MTRHKLACLPVPQSCGNDAANQEGFVGVGGCDESQGKISGQKNCGCGKPNSTSFNEDSRCQSHDRIHVVDQLSGKAEPETSNVNLSKQGLCHELGSCKSLQGESCESASVKKRSVGCLSKGKLKKVTLKSKSFHKFIQRHKSSGHMRAAKLYHKIHHGRANSTSMPDDVILSEQTVATSKVSGNLEMKQTGKEETGPENLKQLSETLNQDKVEMDVRLPFKIKQDSYGERKSANTKTSENTPLMGDLVASRKVTGLEKKSNSEVATMVKNFLTDTNQLSSIEPVLGSAREKVPVSSESSSNSKLDVGEPHGLSYDGDMLIVKNAPKDFSIKGVLFGNLISSLETSVSADSVSNMDESTVTKVEYKQTADSFSGDSSYAYLDGTPKNEKVPPENPDAAVVSSVDSDEKLAVYTESNNDKCVSRIAGISGSSHSLGGSKRRAQNLLASCCECKGKNRSKHVINLPLAMRRKMRTLMAKLRRWYLRLQLTGTLKAKEHHLVRCENTHSACTRNGVWTVTSTVDQESESACRDLLEEESPIHFYQEGIVVCHALSQVVSQVEVYTESCMSLLHCVNEDGSVCGIHSTEIQDELDGYLCYTHDQVVLLLNVVHVLDDQQILPFSEEELKHLWLVHDIITCLLQAYRHRRRLRTQGASNSRINSLIVFCADVLVPRRNVPFDKWIRCMNRASTIQTKMLEKKTFIDVCQCHKVFASVAGKRQCAICNCNVLFQELCFGTSGCCSLENSSEAFDEFVHDPHWSPSGSFHLRELTPTLLWFLNALKNIESSVLKRILETHKSQALSCHRDAGLFACSKHRSVKACECFKDVFQPTEELSSLKAQGVTSAASTGKSGENSDAHVKQLLRKNSELVMGEVQNSNSGAMKVALDGSVSLSKKEHGQHLPSDEDICTPVEDNDQSLVSLNEYEVSIHPSPVVSSLLSESESELSWLWAEDAEAKTMVNKCTGEAKQVYEGNQPKSQIETCSKSNIDFSILNRNEASADIEKGFSIFSSDSSENSSRDASIVARTETHISEKGKLSKSDTFQLSENVLSEEIFYSQCGQGDCDGETNSESVSGDTSVLDIHECSPSAYPPSGNLYSDSTKLADTECVSSRRNQRLSGGIVAVISTQNKRVNRKLKENREARLSEKKSISGKGGMFQNQATKSSEAPIGDTDPKQDRNQPVERYKCWGQHEIRDMYDEFTHNHSQSGIQNLSKYSQQAMERGEDNSTVLHSIACVTDSDSCEILITDSGDSRDSVHYLSSNERRSKNSKDLKDEDEVINVTDFEELESHPMSENCLVASIRKDLKECPSADTEFHQSEQSEQKESVHSLKYRRANLNRKRTRLSLKQMKVLETARVSDLGSCEGTSVALKATHREMVEHKNSIKLHGEEETTSASDLQSESTNQPKIDDVFPVSVDENHVANFQASVNSSVDLKSKEGEKNLTCKSVPWRPVNDRFCSDFTLSEEEIDVTSDQRIQDESRKEDSDILEVRDKSGKTEVVVSEVSLPETTGNIQKNSHVTGSELSMGVTEQSQVSVNWKEEHGFGSKGAEVRSGVKKDLKNSSAQHITNTLCAEQKPFVDTECTELSETFSGGQECKKSVMSQGIDLRKRKSEKKVRFCLINDPCNTKTLSLLKCNKNCASTKQSTSIIKEYETALNCSSDSDNNGYQGNCYKAKSLKSSQKHLLHKKCSVCQACASNGSDGRPCVERQQCDGDGQIPRACKKEERKEKRSKRHFCLMGSPLEKIQEHESEETGAEREKHFAYSEQLDIGNRCDSESRVMHVCFAEKAAEVTKREVQTEDILPVTKEYNISSIHSEKELSHSLLEVSERCVKKLKKKTCCETKVCPADVPMHEKSPAREDSCMPRCVCGKCVSTCEQGTDSSGIPLLQNVSKTCDVVDDRKIDTDIIRDIDSDEMLKTLLTNVILAIDIRELKHNDDNIQELDCIANHHDEVHGRKKSVYCPPLPIQEKNKRAHSVGDRFSKNETVVKKRKIKERSEVYNTNTTPQECVSDSDGDEWELFVQNLQKQFGVFPG